MKFLSIIALAASVATAVSAAPSPVSQPPSPQATNAPEPQAEGWNVQHNSPVFAQPDQVEDFEKQEPGPNEAQRRGIDFYNPFLSYPKRRGIDFYNPFLSYH